MSFIFLIYLVLHQFSHHICEARKKLNDCHNLLKYYRKFFTTPMNCASKLSSYVTMTLTFSSSQSMSFLHIQQLLLDWNCSSSSLMIKFLLKCFFITFLHYSYSLRIASKNLKAAFSPLKTTIGLLNLSSTQTSL